MSPPDLLEVGIYTAAEAAHLVGVSEQKIRGWIAGYPRRSAPPIVQNDIGWSSGRLAFSFRNLMEMRFIACFEEAGVSFNHIRSIMAEVKIVTRRPHPFATNIVFKTDGKKIVGQVYDRVTGDTFYDLRTRNLEMFHVVYDTLKHDVIYDFNGEAKSWYPRRKSSPNVVIHPMFAFGRPVLKKSGIPTRTLADAVEVEKNIPLVADLFELAPREVREAVQFETELRKAA